MSWETLYKIINILQDETWHFILSAIMGVLVFLLIVTIFLGAYWILRKVSHSNVSLDTGLKRFILLMAFGYGLVSVWLSHMLLDWFVVLYHTPLGPHLPLILK